ncbi:hypothetical protein J6590_009974, partial [Homalodisca vitripennis]
DDAVILYCFTTVDNNSIQWLKELLGRDFPEFLRWLGEEQHQTLALGEKRRAEPEATRVVDIKGSGQ